MTYHEECLGFIKHNITMKMFFSHNKYKKNANISRDHSCVNSVFDLRGGRLDAALFFCEKSLRTRTIKLTETHASGDFKRVVCGFCVERGSGNRKQGRKVGKWGRIGEGWGGKFDSGLTRGLGKRFRGVLKDFTISIKQWDFFFFGSVSGLNKRISFFLSHMRTCSLSRRSFVQEVTC